MDHILIHQTRQKEKKVTQNPENKDDKCFQYTATVELNPEEITSYPERVSNIKPFINKYKLKRIIYPSKIENWKRFEKKKHSNNRSQYFLY